MDQYTKQFKLQIAKEGISAKTYAEVSRKYDINTKQVREWTKAYEQYGELAFDPDGPAKYQEQRIKELERQIAELSEENEILKKAAAYFSKRNL